MKAVCEGDHSGAICGCTGNLDRVFNGFCAAGKEDRFSRTNAGEDAVEFGRQLDIGLIHRDLEAGMCDLIKLGFHGVNDTGMVMTDVHHANAADEVNIFAAFNIPQACAARPGRNNRMGCADTACDMLDALGHEVLSTGRRHCCHK